MAVRLRRHAGEARRWPRLTRPARARRRRLSLCLSCLCVCSFVYVFVCLCVCFRCCPCMRFLHDWFCVVRRTGCSPRPSAAHYPGSTPRLPAYALVSTVEYPREYPREYPCEYPRECPCEYPREYSQVVREADRVILAHKLASTKCGTDPTRRTRSPRPRRVPAASLP